MSVDYRVELVSDAGWSESVTGLDDLPAVPPPMILAVPLVYRWSYEDGMFPARWTPPSATFTVLADSASVIDDRFDLDDIIDLTIRLGTTTIAALKGRVTAVEMTTIHARDRDTYAGYKVAATATIVDVIADLESITADPVDGALGNGADRTAWRSRLAQLAESIGRRITIPSSWGDLIGEVVDLADEWPNGSARKVADAQLVTMAGIVAGWGPYVLMTRIGDAPGSGWQNAGSAPGIAWTAPPAHGWTHPAVELVRAVGGAWARLAGTSPNVTYGPVGDTAPVGVVGGVVHLSGCAVLSPLKARRDRSHAITRIRISGVELKDAPSGTGLWQWAARTVGRRTLPGRPPRARQLDADSVVRFTANNYTSNRTEQVRAHVDRIAERWRPDPAAEAAAWATEAITVTVATLTAAGLSEAQAADTLAALVPTITKPAVPVVIAGLDGLTPSSALSGWATSGELTIQAKGDVTYQIGLAPGIPLPAADAITWNEFDHVSNPYRLILPTALDPAFRIYEWVWITDPQDW